VPTPSPRIADSVDWHSQALYELPLGVVLLDQHGDIGLVTRRAEELLEQQFDEIVSTVSQLASPTGANSRRIEVDGRDGTHAVVEGTAIQVRRAGELVGTILTFEDITARERRERAERDFVTNAAHELQTPLAAITSAVQVLQAGAKNDVADRDRFLGHVEQACRRLERLARALLVLARAQTGAETPRREIVPLSTLLHIVADGLPPGREVEVECASDVAVFANQPLLEQALVNLAQNAAKHSPGRIQLTGVRSNGQVRIQVRDTGTGIDEADRDRVFERFYRGEAPNSGFGLGLAIVAEAVKAIDGSLELETSTSGTSASITLPGATIVTR
jgi:signal transduction histidine kinase